MRHWGEQVLVCDMRMLKKGATYGISSVSCIVFFMDNAYCFLEQLEQDFPYWKCLHGFWRTLPNFNPYTASSEPGQDLASEALALIQGRGRNNSEDEYATDGAADVDDDAGSTQQVIQVCHCFFFVLLAMIRIIG